MENNQLLILGLLRKRSMYGYELMEYLDRVMYACVQIKRPTAYFILEKMEKAGWITSREEQNGRRPLRRVYELTDQGEQAYFDLLKQNLSTFTQVNLDDDLGLAFLADMDADEAVDLLGRRRFQLEANISRLSSAPQHEGTVAWLIEHQQRYLQHELDWLDEVVKRIKASQQKE